MANLKDGLIYVGEKFCFYKKGNADYQNPSEDKAFEKPPLCDITLGLLINGLMWCAVGAINSYSAIQFTQPAIDDGDYIGPFFYSIVPALVMGGWCGALVPMALNILVNCQSRTCNPRTDVDCYLIPSYVAGLSLGHMINGVLSGYVAAIVSFLTNIISTQQLAISMGTATYAGTAVVAGLLYGKYKKSRIQTNVENPTPTLTPSSEPPEFHYISLLG